MVINATYRSLLGKGLLFGVVAGALWIASRPYNGTPPTLINWRRVRDAALSVSDREAPDDLVIWPSKTELTERYQSMVRQSERAIAGYVGQWTPGRQNSTYVFDRREWVEANLANFQLMFEPIEKLNRQALNDGTVGSYVLGSVNQLVLSAELGALVGFLSRRVLGQYDMALLGREPITNGRLYFVEPNIARLQERLGLDPAEFRLWIALHETTHAYEFEGHPWLRDHMNGLLNRYFDSLTADILGLHNRPNGLIDLAGRIGTNLFRSRYALELVMNEEQRAVFNQLQALMCLIEGFSNHVMDQIGRSLLPSYPTLKERFEDRLRHKSLGEQLFARLTGLDVKLEQYRLGERFVNEVVAARGIDFANRAWTSPWHLPTLEEVKQPVRWLERVEGR